MTRRWTALGALVAAVVALTPEAAQAVTFQSDPSISGPESPPREGQVLTGSDGTPQPDFPETSATVTSRQWYRCTPGCAAIPGATTNSYTLAVGDAGSTIVFENTATSDLGTTAIAQSAPTSQVRTDPSNDIPPVIAGTPEDGQTLTVTQNVWSGTGPITLSYQWFRCDRGGTNCFILTGATAATYVLTPADIGFTLRVQVTGDGPGPSTPPSALSQASPVVEAASPLNTARPDFTGTLRQGRLLTLTPGTWTGTQPIDFSYRWQRCTGQSPASCENIPGATELDYRLTVNDVANRVRVVVTAKNEAPGTTTATSPLSEPIAGPEVPGAEPRRISPFPRITIGGVARRRTSDIALLRVRGPRGTLVTVFCRGRSCPFRRFRRRIGRARELRIRPLERRLRSGTEIELFVTRAGSIGKYTLFRIRRGKGPMRRDACVRPGATVRSPCP